MRVEICNVFPPYSKQKEWTHKMHIFLNIFYYASDDQVTVGMGEAIRDMLGTGCQLTSLVFPHHELTISALQSPLLLRESDFMPDLNFN